ncbi:hypothetical protein ABZ397_31135, partial [Streptomyces sp. NPDC005876]
MVQTPSAADAQLTAGAVKVFEQQCWQIVVDESVHGNQTDDELASDVLDLTEDSPQLVLYLPRSSGLADGLQGLGAFDGLADVVAG